MRFPERFSNLPAYAFPRLRDLLDHHQPGGPVLPMSIGEPTHPMPEFIAEELAKHTQNFAKYPPNHGSEDLLSSIAGWISRRYNVSLDPKTEIFALNGTREGLFNACLALCPETKNGKKPRVLIPNPFYQVYMVAAITAGATPEFVPALAENGFLPDFASLPATVLDETAICYLCSPSNPQGAVASREYWQDLIALAEKHDFRIFADECYSEVYRNEAPVGAIQVAHEMGIDKNRVVIFHSLSKRSNLPGIRSGFAATGAENILALKQLRDYTGAPLPGPLQSVAARVWDDEDHVKTSRAMYLEKYTLADEIFGDIPGFLSPEAGFFLWLNVKDGETACKKLWVETGVRTLPGKYLSRPTEFGDPGEAYLRVAMVAPMEQLEQGLRAIRACLYKR
jgi:aspartate/methionine/tyrosine aminotransferase